MTLHSISWKGIITIFADECPEKHSQTSERLFFLELHCNYTARLMSELLLINMKNYTARLISELLLINMNTW
jgi:hypothetical protein